MKNSEPWDRKQTKWALTLALFIALAELPGNREGRETEAEPGWLPDEETKVRDEGDQSNRGSEDESTGVRKPGDHSQ